jgi:outer membrane immunogenic protein
MKRILFSVATVVAMAAPALAADMRAPVMKAPPMPAMSWTGCYLGGGGGYGLWDQRVTSFSANVQTDARVDNGGRGWFGTVGGGCDVQVSSNWLVGFFADYDFSDIHGDASVPLSGLSYAGSEKMRSAWSVGGRIGYLITPSVLTYFSGGFTEARFGSINLTRTSLTTPAFTIGSHTYSGWFLGGGYEYQLNWLPGWFWKTEYRFSQYETDSLPLVVYGTGAATSPALSIDSAKYVQTIRSELVYRFNWGHWGR